LTPGRVGDPGTARLFARPYRDVAARLERWRRDGQLLPAPEPAVYVHEYTSGGLTVRGIVASLDLARRAADTDAAAVLPHEGIHPDQVADLADRMGTWGLNPAPILLVHRGPDLVRDIVERVSRVAPLHEYVDRVGQQHRIWTVREAADVDSLNDALAGSRALIADGHHRYAAYLRMQQDGSGPTDRGLVMLVDQADTPLFLGAIHRVLQGLSLEDLAQACPASVTFAPVAATDAFSGLTQDTLVATDGQNWATIKVPLPGDLAAVEVLHDQLLPPLRLAQRRIGFHHSVDDALTKVRSMRGVAVLMPAPEFDLVVRIAQAGRLLPEKATSFQPKPSIGALMRALDDE
jgi:uncharacterized protein (DUF1015 family)